MIFQQSPSAYRLTPKSPSPTPTPPSPSPQPLLPTSNLTSSQLFVPVQHVPFSHVFSQPTSPPKSLSPPLPGTTIPKKSNTPGRKRKFLPPTTNDDTEFPVINNLSNSTSPLPTSTVNHNTNDIDIENDSTAIKKHRIDQIQPQQRPYMNLINSIK
ncbi:hypothetical protein DLAC_01719 [Tieghemostelium lacteum]|uniref:Uncharacterized protein n=1 Tax=Tieghemostelium lacteum TaxID=361077 RepID=A0A152A6G1_TIELA|nr:hypothetical protein DLAC_01719 [Tieghemostelium lacteum]|eukprot:KYR01711.1 hypothetical protein DLAC_01719 [Tieghemostelium lacteum]